MLTQVGQYLRMFRIKNNLLLKDMADKLKISSAYLSAIENGKRKPTDDFIDKVKESYDIKGDDAADLMDAFFETIKSITIDTSSTNEDQSNLGLVFARKINNLSKAQITNIQDILNNKN